jgi:hypothetical protein
MRAIDMNSFLVKAAGSARDGGPLHGASGRIRTGVFPVISNGTLGQLKTGQRRGVIAATARRIELALGIPWATLVWTGKDSEAGGESLPSARGGPRDFDEAFIPTGTSRLLQGR